jgi:cell division FtsZ-interacting protein ZapD
MNEMVELKEIPIQLQLMLKTIEGIYQNGQIQLIELPQDVSSRAQVLVTFVDPSQIDTTKLGKLIEQLETIAAIQQGFEELNAGQTRSIEDFVQEIQQKYDISKNGSPVSVVISKSYDIDFVGV